MAIHSDDLEFLTLRMFGKLNVPAGGTLDAETLQAEWRKTRLRRSDLHQGLQLLLIRGALHKAALGYQLTQDGFSRAGLIRQHPIRSAMTRMRIMTKLKLLRGGTSGERRQRPSGEADRTI